MPPENIDPKEEALRLAAEKIKESSSSAEEEILPSSPETDPGLEEKFPDAPEEKEPEPTSEPQPQPPLDAKLSFSCSIQDRNRSKRSDTPPLSLGVGANGFMTVATCARAVVVRNNVSE